MECYLFNHCGSTLRRQRFDKLLSSKEYRLMSMDEKFDQSIQIIMNENLPNLKRSLLQAPAEGNMILPQTHFKLGLFALSQNKPDVAMVYFGQARKKFEKRQDKDKANFWMYLVSKNKGYLQNLLNSYHVNMYTLAARDMMKMKYPKTITPRLNKARIGNFNIQDPIHWAYLKEKMFSGEYNLNQLADQVESDETIGIYTYIKAQASNFKEAYFPMPYRDFMARLSPKRQALLYAIARQESRFVPASVSRSFALGMMQIMPFLVEDIAKKKGERIDLDEIFNPYKALDYANFHLDYLTSYLYHPLFVAYAYNGGIGFTKNLITNGKYFRPGPYQPYWSMETIQNVEAREYGKSVLTNYVIYLNKLGVPTRILPFLDALTDPSKTDKFRQ
ncbi:MAG: transglycosylase SLT domain-containing protein [Campylobacterales bacterium]|nr:transglycosylase SLT domain-containing protein [Campylobacterales bacterium]